VCLEEAKRYGEVREAFKKRVSDLPIIKNYLLEMERKILLGEALTHRALAQHAQGKECRALVAMAKRLMCDDAVWVADRAIQIHGGYGYTTEFTPERWWRDLRLMPIGGGTSEIMAGIVVKELSRAAKQGS
jgi:alkylation response protein AidB-like acyl-CoA dehydrogenase